MPKIRIHELAKEMGVISTDIMKYLPTIGISVKSHFAVLESDAIEKVRRQFSGKKSQTAEAKNSYTAQNQGQTQSPGKAQDQLQVQEPGQSQTQSQGLRQSQGQSQSQDQGQSEFQGQGQAQSQSQSHGQEPSQTQNQEQSHGQGSGQTQSQEQRQSQAQSQGQSQAQERPERPVRLGPDGKPLPRRERPLGPDGKPLPRPLGPDGNPLPRPLGPDGRPMQRPVRLGPDGKPLPRRERPLGPDGKPIPRPLGPDGKPLQRPVRLGPDGKPLPRRERPLGPDGKPIPRPLGPDGKPIQRQLGPDGNPLPRPLGPDGKPMQRPARLGPDGKPLPRRERPLGPDGKPLSRSNQSDQRRDPKDKRPDRPQRTDRPPYKPGERPPFRPSGERPPYKPGDKPPFRQGDKPPYKPGDKPPFRSGGGFSGGAGKPSIGRGPGIAGKGNKPQGAQKGQDAPDKHGRRQKIEASSKKDKRKDRLTYNDKEKMLTPKQAAVIAKAPLIPQEPKVIQVPAVLTLKELAEKMNKQGAELVKALIKKGEMISINQEISFEKAMEIAMEYNIIVEEKIEIDILEEVFSEDEEKEEVLVSRPPVVVVMGHVDHGKTSLLDAIRNTDVVHGESGGITQHIGAYTVSINDRPITFLDTPGHEAFTAMRMRGAQVTDIAVLVVAADDGVMPQTIEAISHAKAAGVEIIVAINKIDKPSANPDRVMQELTEHELVAEAYGGDVICARVSAHTKEGIDGLLEMILLVADMKEYKANPNKKARGTIIEAQLDRGRGPVATVLVKAGTLQVGDPIVAGTAHGRIRAMINDKGQKVKEAAPSIPVEILGLHSVPDAGDLFHIARNEKEARYVAETIIAKNRVKLLAETPQKVSLDDLFNQIQAGKVKELNIIVKADVGGSVEAVKASLEKLSNEEVRIRILLGGVGAVTESDVMLASASNALIIGFNVRPEPSAKQAAQEHQVDIRLYRIIYNAIDDIQAAMKGMLDPIFEEKIIGHAQIRQLFKASGIGTIGGAYVVDGKMSRSASVRVLRDNIVVYEGTLDTLRRFKDDVKEVLTNYECGIVLTKFNDIKEGDIIEAFVMEEIKR